jgi:glycosyltransferase involved in cell wall biosynthesis
MAMGLPIVSTTIGAEGLRYSHGENIIMADGAGDFARAVIEALQNKALSKKIGRAARKFVIANFSWSRIADQFLEAIQDNETSRAHAHS